jgi:hypothetical protein
MVAPSFEVKQKVLQLIVQRIVVENHHITIEHVVPSGPIRLQPEHHAPTGPSWGFLPVPPEGYSPGMRRRHELRSDRDWKTPKPTHRIEISDLFSSATRALPPAVTRLERSTYRYPRRLFPEEDSSKWKWDWLFCVSVRRRNGAVKPHRDDESI